MRLADIDFHLPPELIAQNPVEPRDAARLLVYNTADRSISHHHISDLPNLLPVHTTLVANRSRVRKGRLYATRANGQEVELLILEPATPGCFECMIRGKGIHDNEELQMRSGTILTVVAPHNEASFTTYIIDFGMSTEDAEAIIEEYGVTPLPPYITESEAPDDRYQTVFAQELGSAAAPTAGLHITPNLMEELIAKGHAWEEVILHVGMGTFQPLRQEEITDNKLHHEYTFIANETSSQINEAKGHILAIGTTSCRVLESHSQSGTVEAGDLSTDLFIYPGYIFQTTNMLLTNFHLPKSSLLLLVASLIAQKCDLQPDEAIAELHRIYRAAIGEQYRFFSFGDAMLVR